MIEMRTLKKTTLLLGTAILLGSKPLAAQGGCTRDGNAGSCCPSTSTAAAAPATTTRAKLDGTAGIVFENYLAIQTSLASDSVAKVAANAEAIATILHADSGHNFPPETAAQASALAQSRDLTATRRAFEPLSQSLVWYVQAGKVPAGALFELYCPMAKASWLQPDKSVRNPYFGRSMLNCGVVKLLPDRT